jgi:hypothetical protein
MAKTQRAQHDNEAEYVGTKAETIAMKHARKKKDQQLYKTLKHHFHPIHNSGLTHIIIPDKDKQGVPTDNVDDADTWKTETEPTTVLQKIMERNIKHFGQADGTPFTTEPIFEKFG